MKKLGLLSVLILFSCSSEDSGSWMYGNSVRLDLCFIEGRWNLEGLETQTLFEFTSTQKHSISAEDGVFGGLETADPNPEAFILSFDSGNSYLLINDYNHPLKWKGDCNVIAFYREDGTVWRWWKDTYTIEECNE